VKDDMFIVMDLLKRCQNYDSTDCTSDNDPLL